jgi:hypothetical protein
MNYKIEILPLANYFVVAVKDKETAELKETFTLNESAADMLRLFCQNKDVATVANEMSDIYDTPLDVITKHVEKFAETLMKKGLM